jgi:signal transduction histidine kinase
VSRSRSFSLAVVTAGVLALAACGSGTSSEPTTAPATSAEALDDTTAWADGICTSLVDVRTAVDGIGEGLQINPLDGSGALDDAKSQISTQVDAVRAAVADVRAAVADAPDDPEVQAAKAELVDALDALDAAQAELATQAEAAASADSVAAFVAAAAGAVTALQGAGSAISDVYSTATGGASEVRGEVRGAFESAPACQALNS